MPYVVVIDTGSDMLVFGPFDTEDEAGDFANGSAPCELGISLDEGDGALKYYLRTVQDPDGDDQCQVCGDDLNGSMH
jgi:hypothetical protein